MEIASDHALKSTSFDAARDLLLDMKRFQLQRICKLYILSSLLLVQYVQTIGMEMLNWIH